MLFAQHGVLGSGIRSVPANAFKILVIGDSNANGAATTIVPCAPRTLWNYNNTLTPGTPFIEEVTTQTINTEIPAGTLSPSPILVRSCDNTNTAGTDILFQGGNYYADARTGTTKQILKNKVVHATATQAVVVSSKPFTITIGAVNGTAGRSSFLACKYSHIVISSYDKTLYDSWQDATDTYDANF